MAKITDTGIVPKTWLEYLDELKQAYWDIDPEWILDSNSPDGQRTIIAAKKMAELDQEQVSTYNARDPRTAKNSQVDDLAALQDVYREQERQSLVTLSLTGTDGTVVDEGSQIRNILTGSVWSLTHDVTIPGEGEFQSIDYGLITATGEFEIMTPVDGWSAATNPTNFQIGRDEESDEEVENRRQIEVTKKSTALRDAIRANVLAVTGVLSCDVIENDEQTPVNGQPGNSVHVVAMGGDELEICQAINAKMSLGCKTIGDIEYQVTTEDDPYGMPRRFDRPTLVDIWVRYTIKNGAKIEKSDKEKVGEYVELYSRGKLSLPFDANNNGFTLGQSPSANLMSTPLNMVLGSYIASDSSIYTQKVEISKDGTNWTTEAIEISRLESALFSAEKVSFEDA